MRTFILVAAMALTLQSARADDGAPGDGGQAPPAARRAAPKDPPGALASKLDKALQAYFGGTTAGRTLALANLKATVVEWQEAAKDDPLRASDWWRGALARTLPSGNARRTGVFEEKVPYLGNREATLHIALPKTYSGKTAWPVLIRIMDKAEDARRALPAIYGDLLKEFIVVGISEDAKAAGFDVVKEPWHTGLALKFAIENYHVDRDRVFLDGAARLSSTVQTLGSEWAVHFAGCILREPAAVAPLASNLSLGSTLLVTSKADGEAVTGLKTLLPAATVLAVEGAGGTAEAGAAEVQKWLRAAAPRTISRADSEGFSWSAAAEGGEVWAYWLWMFRATPGKADRAVKLSLRWDGETNTVHLTAENLAEAILLLDDRFLDLDREVSVKVNGREAWKGLPERSLATALFWISQTGERTLFAPAEVRITVPRDALAPPSKDGADGKEEKPGTAPEGGDASAPVVPDDAPTPPQEEDPEEKTGETPAPSDTPPTPEDEEETDQ